MSSCASEVLHTHDSSNALQGQKVDQILKLP